MNDNQNDESFIAALEALFVETISSPEFKEELSQRVAADLEAEKRVWRPEPKATTQEQSLLTYTL